MLTSPFYIELILLIKQRDLVSPFMSDDFCIRYKVLMKATFCASYFDEAPY